MGAEAVKSKAFQRAALKSESYRVVGILVLLGVMLLFVVARAALTGRYLLVAIQGGVLLLIAAHEAGMWRTIKRALRGEREVSPDKWVLNVFIESQIPTIALFILIATHWFTPRQILVAPVVLVYFLLIILSTLRLSPTLSLVTGILSALGYLFVVLYTTMSLQGAPEPGAFPQVAYYVYAATILSGGIVAAIVAGEIRIHVAAALREAELQNQLDKVTHDLEVAKSIQQGLLPTSSPELDEFEIAGWNQPADQTGGDYFDWQSLPDGRVAISLADATGHGIGPALVGASCRAYARASFLVGGAQNGVLENLNGLLASDLSSNRFVTYAVIFLDPKSGEVRVLSAGHGPILWYKHESGNVENLDAHGIPLGMIAGVAYSHGTEGQLEAGDILALVTDGFYEWTNPEGEEFGLNRLANVIRESHELPASQIIEKLRLEVDTFRRGTAQQDDLTAVIIKRTSNGRHPML